MKFYANSFQKASLILSLARMAEDLFVRPDGKPMTFLMNSSQEKKKVKFDPNVSLCKVSPWVFYFVCHQIRLLLGVYYK